MNAAEPEGTKEGLMGEEVEGGESFLTKSPSMECALFAWKRRRRRRRRRRGRKTKANLCQYVYQCIIVHHYQKQARVAYVRTPVGPTDEPTNGLFYLDGRLKHTSHIVTRVKSCPLNSNEIHAPNIPDRLKAKD